MNEQYLNDDLRTITVLNKLPLDVAYKYLNIYVGFSDWETAIKKLWVSQKISGDKEKLKKVVCATILLPYVDRSTRIDLEHPDNLLQKMPWFQQLNDKDWFAEFQKIFDTDGKIDACRRKSYSLGVITPFEYAPIARQAYNWLFAKAEESGIVTTDSKADISERFKNMVAAYGGAVICNIFSRHSEKLKKVINWRTGYFFEKIIYEVYSPEQIYKIKKSELDSTNTKLVKSVRII